jgi:hypothetical protein
MRRWIAAIIAIDRKPFAADQVRVVRVELDGAERFGQLGLAGLGIPAKSGLGERIDRQ